MKHFLLCSPRAIRLLALLFSAFCAFQTQAQTGAYYSNGPEGITPFALDTTRLIVAFDPALSSVEKKAMLARVSARLDYLPGLEFPQFNATVLHLNGANSAETQALLQTLNQTRGLRWAAPFLRYADGTPQGILDEILVGLHQESDLAMLETACKFLGLSAPVRNAFDPLVFTVKVSDNRMGRALELANSLYETGVPAFAEVNFMRILAKLTTNDPLQISQWSQDNDGRYWNGSAWVYVGTAGADMKIEETWPITTGSASVKVAVLDDGVNTSHPDLSANMLAGFDATGLGSNGNPSGNDSHGTACAGIIAARANNNLGLAGNAYNCKIVPVRIAYTPAGQNGWYTSNTWLANGINWAWQTGGASVLSNSWGGGSFSSAISTAVTNAVTSGRGGKGSPVLFSAGNSDVAPVFFPSNLTNAISVGASSLCDTRKSSFSCDGESWWGSNYGTGLDVMAPGVKITTTDIAGAAGSNTGDYTFSFNGTSAACPNAASVVALILSVNNNLTGAQARQILESTCQKVGGYTYSTTSGQPNGSWSTQMGYGRINALAAVQAAQSSSCAAPTTAQLSVTNITATSVRLNCSVSGVQAYDWRYRPIGAASWIDLPGGTNNFYNLSGLTANTAYEFSASVRCGASTWSNWSAALSFNTTGAALANDNPCNATLITANSNCVNTNSTNAGATATFNDLVCETSAPKDVWFRCAIPSSGVVTFRTTAGSLVDAMMAVYWNSCSNLTYITCEDDNSNGNGSLMPVIGITGQPGTLLWIRVWGFNNTMGTFSICALNYNSANLTGEDGGVFFNLGEDGTVTAVPAEMVTHERDASETILSAATGALFPNPTSGDITLPYTLLEDADVQITIADPLGRIVFQSLQERTQGDHFEQIDLSELPTGAYFLRFQSGNSVNVQQLHIRR